MNSDLLSALDVQRIKQLWEAGKKPVRIAARLRISQQAIEQLIKEKTSKCFWMRTLNPPALRLVDIKEKALPTLKIAAPVTKKESLKRTWAEDQDDALTALWNADVRLNIIAEELNRTESAVRARAGVLKLHTRHHLKRHQQAASHPFRGNVSSGPKCKTIPQSGPEDAEKIAQFIKTHGVTKLPPGQAAGISDLEQQTGTTAGPMEEWRNNKLQKSRMRGARSMRWKG